MSNRTRSADIYMRLSSEEAGKNESSSITNQRSFIQRYCLDNNISIVKEFVDDGYSGSNFERPGFVSMLSHIKEYGIEMVITKDLSRLGRDMAESSRYAEKYFPENNIHYVAINDNFDSDTDNVLAPFQFAMNDVYLRDTSRKIKAVLHQKKETGKYAACPPFGYKKENNFSDHLIPDENTAPTVRLIFKLASQGFSTRQIAYQLNGQNICPPLKYRVLYRDQFSEKGASRASDEWNYTTVKRILKNKVYLGHTVLGKTKKVSLKSDKKIPVPKDNWYFTANTHEALATQEQFDLASSYIERNTRRYNECVDNNGGKRVSIFRGLVRCASCGGAMCSGGSVYRGERFSYWYLVCNNIPVRSQKQCKNGARIKYCELVDIITNELNHIIDLSDTDIKNIIKEINRNSDVKEKTNAAKKRIEQIKKEVNETDKIISKLYIDNMSGKISDDRLNRIVSEIEAKTEKMKQESTQLESTISEDDDREENYIKFFNIVKQYSHITELTTEILNAFIERIDIGKRITTPNGDEQQITIYYKFIGEFHLDK